jgi:hypothetical protein
VGRQHQPKNYFRKKEIIDVVRKFEFIGYRKNKIGQQAFAWHIGGKPEYRNYRKSFGR